MSDSPIGDMELKYDGKILLVTIVINTDRDPYDVLRGIKRAAQGPRFDAALISMEGYSGEDSVKVWKEVQRVVVEVAANPKASRF